MIKEIKQVIGTGVVVKGDNIDTDRIIPARYLKQLTFDALAEGAFIDDRIQMKKNGDLHSFDNPIFTNGSVLIVNTNFGCGSSREAAPQALYRYGIRAIIGVTFGEIFFSTSIAIGMPCVKVAEADADKIQALTQDGQVGVKIELENEFIIVDEKYKFLCEINEGVKIRLISGTWDALDELTRYADEIDSVYNKLPYTSWNVSI